MCEKENQNSSFSFLLFAIIMFSANIISSEYSKGTIKQLLLTPYTRKEILISKYIIIPINLPYQTILVHYVKFLPILHFYK